MDLVIALSAAGAGLLIGYVGAKKKSTSTVPSLFTPC